MTLQIERAVPPVVREASGGERGEMPGGRTEMSVLRAAWVPPELEERLTALERYLTAETDDSSPRPKRGRSVGLTLAVDDCERIESALRQVALEAAASGDVLLGATALEVELDEVCAFLDGRSRPTRVGVDLADCALMAFALLYVSGRFEGPDTGPFRRTGMGLFDRLSNADREFVDPR